MSSEVAPLLIGFAAAGLLLVVIGIVLAARRLFERIRLRPRRQSRGSEGWATSQEWAYRPRVPREVRAEPPGSMSKAEASVGEPSAIPQGSSVAVEEREPGVDSSAAVAEAQPAVGEPSADGQGSLAAVDEARREAKVMLAAAERRCERLLRDSEAEAGRRAGEITEDARKQARELLEEAELEAKKIIADAGQERLRLLNELERERAVVEETRTRLSTFLVDVLEEVEGAPAPTDGTANIRDVSDARGLKTSAGGD